MKVTRKISLHCLLSLCVLAVLGCSKKADENRPVAEVKAEAEKMDTAELRSMAMAYKSAFDAKSKESEKLVAKIKEIPVAEMLGEEVKALKTELEKIGKSASSLKERFQIYYDKLKEKGGDLSGLQI